MRDYLIGWTSAARYLAYYGRMRMVLEAAQHIPPKTSYSRGYLDAVKESGI